MKTKGFILGFFHECDSDEKYCNHIDDFRRAHGGFVLLITEDTQIWTFPDDGNDEELESAWKEWIGHGYRSTFFELIQSPGAWCKEWSQKFPVMLEGAMKTNLS